MMVVVGCFGGPDDDDDDDVLWGGGVVSRALFGYVDRRSPSLPSSQVRPGCAVGLDGVGDLTVSI